MNVGIGVILGLLAALLAVFLVTKGGPFKEQSAARTIEPSGANSDPNAPLYGPNVAPLPPTANAQGDNSQGSGVDALTDNGTAVPKANVSATPKTAKPVESSSEKDPVAAMIDAANKGKPETNKPEVAKPDAPKPVAPKPVEPVTAPKEVKPTPAPTKKDVQNADK